MKKVNKKQMSLILEKYIHELGQAGMFDVNNKKQRKVKSLQEAKVKNYLDRQKYKMFAIVKNYLDRQMYKTFTIRNWADKSVIYETEALSLKNAVEEAVRNNVSLRWADLGGFDLQRFDLCGADLIMANLVRTNLQKARLCRADLRGADLLGTDLDKAYLEGAKFSISREELENVSFYSDSARINYTTQFNMPLNESVNLQEDFKRKLQAKEGEEILPVTLTDAEKEQRQLIKDDDKLKREIRLALVNEFRRQEEELKQQGEKEGLAEEEQL